MAQGSPLEVSDRVEVLRCGGSQAWHASEDRRESRADRPPRCHPHPHLVNDTERADDKPPTLTGPWSRLRVLVLRRRGVFGVLASCGASALAATWLVVVPDVAGDVGPLQSWLLRYAHSLCWALLALAAATWALRAHRWVAGCLVLGALAAYVSFLTALVV